MGQISPHSPLLLNPQTASGSSFYTLELSQQLLETIVKHKEHHQYRPERRRTQTYA
jgi:hypothetical protein